VIYTFYSYKGGVGRTMALANVAELFYREGLKVLMIDWDLEAPGLEQFFFPEENLAAIRQQRGIVDLLVEYKRQMTHKLDLSDEDNLPFEKPGELAREIYPESSQGKLWLITVGQRLRENPAKYAQAVLDFDWRDFYENWLGEAYFDWFRRECQKMADVILIDSRTGVTEIGGVCTYHLADVIVLFCATNNQNIQGTLEMVQNFSQPALLEVRGERPLKTLVVPSRIDISGATAMLNEFRGKLVKTFDPISEMLTRNPKLFDQLTIPYIATYAFEERIAVQQAAQSAYYSYALIAAYERLAAVLKELGQQIKASWEQKMTTLTRQWEDYGRKFAELRRAKIVATREEEKVRITEEMGRLEQARQDIAQTLEKFKREFQSYLKS